MGFVIVHHSASAFCEDSATCLMRILWHLWPACLIWFLISASALCPWPREPFRVIGCWLTLAAWHFCPMMTLQYECSSMLTCGSWWSRDFHHVATPAIVCALGSIHHLASRPSARPRPTICLLPSGSSVWTLYLPGSRLSASLTMSPACSSTEPMIELNCVCCWAHSWPAKPAGLPRSLKVCKDFTGVLN